MTTATLTELTRRQYVILIIWGAALWFAAALVVRFLAPLGALERPWVLLTYALIVPGTVPFVYLTRAVAGLRIDQTAIGLVIVTTTALFLDGTAFAWIPELYGRGGMAGAASILWGAGVAITLGLLMNGPRPR